VNKAIEISAEDIAFIMSSCSAEFEQEKSGVACRGENHRLRSIAVNTAWLNEKGDLILDGCCKSCSYRMSKYIDCRQWPEARERALYIRELKVKLFKNARIRPR